MAKTYILEPTEAEFAASQDNFTADVNFDWTALDGYPGDEAEDEAIDTFLANTFSGSKFEMMYGEEPISLIYAGADGGEPSFTVSGENVESYPFATVYFYGLDVMRIDVGLSEGASVLPVDGTYTVSIYTGEDEEGGEGDEGGIPGLEDKNVVYQYQLVANNNIKDILMAVMEQNGDNAINIPGYSVMQLLVENLLVFHGITGDKLTTFRATSFANDAEKIAWIIRNA